nr:protein EMSY-LIKE 3-like isoform X2 [Ipomoea batatas]
MTLAPQMRPGMDVSTVSFVSITFRLVCNSAMHAKVSLIGRRVVVSIADVWKQFKVEFSYRKGLTKPQSRKEFPPSQNGIGKKGSDDIQLLHTDTLIKEVERIFGASHPDPAEIEKAKKLLKEHEQSLVDAISRLGEISDGESALVSLPRFSGAAAASLPLLGGLPTFLFAGLLSSAATSFFPLPPPLLRLTGPSFLSSVTCCFLFCCSLLLLALLSSEEFFTETTAIVPCESFFIRFKKSAAPRFLSVVITSSFLSDFAASPPVCFAVDCEGLGFPLLLLLVLLTPVTGFSFIFSFVELPPSSSGLLEEDLTASF